MGGVTHLWAHKAVTSSSLVELQIAEETRRSRLMGMKTGLFKLQSKICLLKVTLLYFQRDFISCLLQLFIRLVK